MTFQVRSHRVLSEPAWGRIPFSFGFSRASTEGGFSAYSATAGMAKPDLEEGRPEGSNREPGLRQEHPPINGLNESSRGTLQLVNSDSVARVVDEQGKPLVVFLLHGRLVRGLHVADVFVQEVLAIGFTCLRPTLSALGIPFSWSDTLKKM